MKELQTYFRRVKNDFPIFQEYPNLVYLDNAATTHKPGVVIEALTDFYSKSNANVHRGVYMLAEKATALYEQGRSTIAGFIGVAPEELAFTRGTTESINALAHSLLLHGGYESVIVPVFEHHSNFVPWQQLSKRLGIEFTPVPVNNGSLDLDLLYNTIDNAKRPFIVTVAGITNTTGYRTPFEEISTFVHDRNGTIILDGAQLIPHEPFDFGKSGVDFLAFSAHKLLGPMGIGVLAGRHKLMEKLHPFMYGGEMIDRVTETETTFAPPPYSMEAGTQNIAGVVGLAAAIDYINEIGMLEVHGYINMLTRYAIRKLQALGGIKLLGPETRHGIIGFVDERIHSHDMAEFLSRSSNVAIRSGHHCAQLQLKELGVGSMARISLYIYNTEEDIDRLVEGIVEAKRWFQ